jgi:predicted kinase
VSFLTWPPALSQAFARRPRTLSKLRRSRIIHILGAPGAGKSTFAAALADRLGLPVFGIDAERIGLLRPGESWPRDDVRSWCNLEDRINDAGRCIVETSGLHGNDVLLLTGRRVLRVLCVADRAVRERRLQARTVEGYPLVGDQADYVARLLRIPSSSVRADVTVDTTRPGGLAGDVERVAVLAGPFLAGE